MPRPTVLFIALALALVACQADGGVDGTTLATVETTTTTTTEVSTTLATVATATTQVQSPTTTTTSVQLGDELVFNGDFSNGEGSASGWELVVGDVAQTVDLVSESGEEHISFFSPVEKQIPWPEARSTVPFEVEPHTDYRLSVEARSVTQGRLFLALVFLDEDGDEILLRGPGAPEVTGSDWETFEATIESSAGAASAYLVMRLALLPDLSDDDAFSVDVNRVSIREVVG